MTQSLSTADRNALSAYRLEQAQKTINEVKFLIDNSLYSTAANRLYYSCFYAALALLVRENISTTTHSGVKTMLSLHFVQTGKIPRDIFHGYIMIYECRQRNDYDTFIDTTKEEIDELYVMGGDFVNAVKALVGFEPVGSDS